MKKIIPTFTQEQAILRNRNKKMPTLILFKREGVFATTEDYEDGGLEVARVISGIPIITQYGWEWEDPIYAKVDLSKGEAMYLSVLLEKAHHDICLLVGYDTEEELIENLLRKIGYKQLADDLKNGMI